MDVDVIDIKSLRKKYLKKRISVDRFREDVSAYFNKATMELDLEFSHLVKWSGDEYTYTVTITLDNDSAITKISPLKCERLCFDDATGSGYKGKRVDEYDYYRLDCLLAKVVD